ncbi:Radical SAM domain-containing protein, partial [Candidatus Magnetomorum sp. HK-1]
MQDTSFYLPDFMSIEITNHCNIKCIICPHGHDLIKNKGYMSFKTFQKIIDEAYTNNLKLRKIGLQGIGESLLHPEFIEMAKYGKSKGFFQQLTTNALFLTPSKADEIIDSNCLDRVEISFDNNAENYNKFKGGKVYDII